MYQRTHEWRGWPSGISLVLVSVSVLGCTDLPEPAREAEGQSLGLEAADGGQACAADDVICNGIDDDCDGEVDEDFAPLCLFGRMAVLCVEGRFVSESCDDGNLCTTDGCGAQGCSHVAISCDDGNACTADSCEPSTGVCGSAPTPGESCDDGNACTSDAFCTASGSCAGGTPVVMDDGNPCTADACDPVSGVSHTPSVGVSCNDGNACSENDACDAAGSCSGSARDMDDHDPCTADSCDPATGSVTHTLVPVGTSCSDGNACNGDETCRLSEYTFSIWSHRAFLHYGFSDLALPPIFVKLSDYGVSPGQVVQLRTQGEIVTPVSTRALAVFSSNTTISDRDMIHRVPGAIASAAPAWVTSTTLIENEGTDIPQDFGIDPTPMSLQVPAGANYLILAVFDRFYDDNSGWIEVKMQVGGVSCMANAAPVIDDGNACTADACDPTTGVSHVPVADGTSCTLGTTTGSCAAGVCVAQ